MASGDYARAESLGHALLEQTSSEDSLRAADLLARTANAARLAGRAYGPFALEAAHKSLAIREAALGSDHEKASLSAKRAAGAVRMNHRRTCRKTGASSAGPARRIQ